MNRYRYSGEQLAEDSGRILRRLADLGGDSKARSLEHPPLGLDTDIPLDAYLSFLHDAGYILLDQAPPRHVTLLPAGQEALDGNRFFDLMEQAQAAEGLRVAPPSPRTDHHTLDPADKTTAPTPRTAVAAESPETHSHTDHREASTLEHTHQIRYSRGDMVGTGGLGVVYRGKQRSINREVAIKEFRDLFKFYSPQQRQDTIKRLQEVIWEHASLMAPGIVTILDLEIDSDPPFFVMEFMPGGNLKQLLKSQDERLPVATAVPLFVQIVEAVAHAHRKGVLHRNLKPENVLLDAEGNAKVGDFGLNRIIQQGEQSQPQMVMSVGTVAYLAPEQFQNPGVATIQSDLYSLGIMLYEMLTGKLPGRRSPMPHAYYEDIPEELDDIFDRMTMDFLNMRYPNLNEVLSDLYASDTIARLMSPRASIQPPIPAAVPGESKGEPYPLPSVATNEPNQVDDAARGAAPPQSNEFLTEDEHHPSKDRPPTSQETGTTNEQNSPSADPLSNRLDSLASDLFGD